MSKTKESPGRETSREEEKKWTYVIHHRIFRLQKQPDWQVSRSSKADLFFVENFFMNVLFSPTDDSPLTPPPPVISDTSETISPPSPTPPPPPQISFCNEAEAPSVKHGKKKKRKVEEVSSSSEGNRNFSS